MKSRYFTNEEVEDMKKALKEHFRVFPNPLAWLDTEGNKSMSTAAIIEIADKKYYLANLEVHSNYVGTKGYVALSANKPLRPIPLVAWGEDHFFKNYKELEFDFLVAEIVIRITELAPRFLPPADRFTQRATILAADGKRVLEQLVGS